MKYEVIIPRNIEKVLGALPQFAGKNIVRHLSILEQNPRPVGSKKLRGKDGWRIRVGDYRVIYKIIEQEKIVLLTKIGHRKEIYR